MQKNNSNMEKFEQSRTAWRETLLPSTPIERHLTTIIAFQDLMFQRAMTSALSAPSAADAVAAEQRQNDLATTLDRLVRLTLDLKQPTKRKKAGKQ